VSTLLRSLLLTLSLALGGASALGQDELERPPGPSMSEEKVDPWALQGQDRPTLPEGWQTLESSSLRLHHDPADRGVALLLARHAARSLPDFADRLQVPTGGVIDVYLARSQEQFRTLQPGEPPHWADGTAWPLRGLVFLRSPELRPGNDEPLTTVLDHELVHVLLGRAFQGRPVPRWLQEGVAQVYARQYTAETTRTLASGLLGRELMGLEDLATGFPADPVRARLAYAQSADLVAWMQNEHGPDAVPTLVRELARGAGFGAAVHTATGQRLSQVDAAWRGRLQDSGLAWTPLVSDTVILSGAAGLLLVGGMGVRRRSRRRLEEMEAEEQAREELARALGEAPEPQWWIHPQPPRADEGRAWAH
jgi:hypothetical protein